MREVGRATWEYMDMVLEPCWDQAIEPDTSNLAYEAINEEYEGLKDWEETKKSKEYWDGTFFMDGKEFWIAGDGHGGQVFYAEKEGGE